MSEKQRREQLKMIQRAIDDYWGNRPICDELGVACQKAFETLIKAEDDSPHYTSVDPLPLDAPNGEIIQFEDTKDVMCFDAERKLWIRIDNLMDRKH